MFSPSEIDHHSKELLAATLRGYGYTVHLPGTDLVFVPGTAVDGIKDAHLLVCQTGKGAVVLDDPSHFNKFIFVQSGFSMTVGDIATKLIASMLAHLNRGAPSVTPQLTDGKEHSHE